MDEGSALVDARLVQAGNYIRTSAGSEWRKIARTAPGVVSVGRRAPGDDPFSAPRITNAEPEKSLVVTLYGGDELHYLADDPIEVRTEQVHAYELGRPDVIRAPDRDLWGKIIRILDGESGTRELPNGPARRSRLLSFACVDANGQEFSIGSYSDITGVESDRPERNSIITRVVRD